MKRAVTKRAENILRRVIASILEEPNGFNMDSFGEFFDPYEGQKKFTVRLTQPDGTRDYVSQKVPPCRSAACIGGHCLINSRIGVRLLKANNAYHVKNGLVEVAFDLITDPTSEAAKILGITDRQARSLFFLPEWSAGYGWPTQFSRRYNKAKSAKKRARIAADRIEHFITTGE